MLNVDAFFFFFLNVMCLLILLYWCSFLSSILKGVVFPYLMLQLGCRLVELLIEIAYVQDPVNQSKDAPPVVRPAFTHKLKPLGNSPR